MVSLKKRYLDLIKKKYRGAIPSFLRQTLYILSIFYGFFINLRNFLYEKGFFRKVKSSRKVISVGNITWGGTGKTSLVIELSKRLSSEMKLAVLARGYGKDELILLKENLEKLGVGVFAGKNRVRLIERLSPNYDLFILDDGFQYRPVEKDCEIAVLNARELFGLGYLIPRGNLRELPSSLRRADFIFITYSLPDREITRDIQRFNSSVPIFFGDYDLEGFRRMDGSEVSLEVLLKQPLACFCAIGYPEGFIAKLEEAGLKLSFKFIFPDHHFLKEKEFKEIERKCIDQGVKILVVTSKDKPRMVFPTQLEILITEVKLKIYSEENFIELIKEKLNLRKSRDVYIS